MTISQRPHISQLGADSTSSEWSVARVSSGGAAQALALIGAGYLTRTMLACGMLRSGPVRSGIGFLD